MHGSHLVATEYPGSIRRSEAERQPWSFPFPFKDQFFPVPKNYSPQMYALLKNNPQDLKYLHTHQASSSEKCIEINTSQSVSDVRHCSSRQVKNPLSSVNFGRTRIQHVDHSGGTPSSLHQQPVSTSSLTPPSTEKGWPGGEMAPFTDAQICDYIGKRLADFRTALKKDVLKDSEANATSSSAKYSKSTQASSVAKLKRASETKSVNKTVSTDSDLAVKKHLTVKHNTFIGSHNESLSDKKCDEHTPVGTLKKLVGSLKNVEIVSELDNLSKGLPQQNWNGNKDNIHLRASTDYSNVKANISAARPQHEEKSLKVLSALPESTFDELTEKHPSLSIKCSSSSKQQYNSLELNINKTWDGIHRVPAVSCGLQHIEEPLDKVKEPHSESSADQTLPGNVLKHPHYEDISEDEVPQPPAKLQNTEHEKLISPCVEKPLYEDISDDEDVQSEDSLIRIPEPNNKHTPFESDSHGHEDSLFQIKTEVISNEEMIPEQQFSPKTQTLDIECVSGETDNGLHERHLEWQTDLSVPCGSSSVLEDEDETAPEKPSAGTLASAVGKVPEPSNKNSPFETNSHEHVELRSQMKTEQLPRLQTNHSVPCGSSSVSEDEDETDDGWITIPIVMSDLKFEPEDEGQVSQERVVLEEEMLELPLIAPTLVPLPARFQIEVFDSVDSFVQAKTGQSRADFQFISGWGQPVNEMNSVGEPHTLQDRIPCNTQSDDSCETEDSCDYSPGREYNKMTGQIWKNRSARLGSKTEDSVPKNEDDVMTVHERETRSLDQKDCIQKPGQFVNAKAGPEQVQQETNEQMFSKEDDVITIDSDEEDERDQEWIHGAKRSLSGSEDSGEASSRNQRRYSPETSDSVFDVVEENLQNRLPSPATQHKSEPHDRQSAEVMQDACSVLSDSRQHSGKMNGRLYSSTGGGDEVITIDSDEEDESTQEFRKTVSRIFSESEDNGDASSSERESPSPETSDGKNETVEIPKPIFADSTVLSHGIKKNGLLVEVNGESERVKQKTNRPIVSEERGAVFSDSNKVVKYRKRIVSSESEDSCEDLPASESMPTETHGPIRKIAKKRSKHSRLSSGDFPQSQHQSVDKPSSEIPQSDVLKSKKPKKSVLVKQSMVHSEGKDNTQALKTPTATSKKADMKGKHLHRNKTGGFVSKPIAANDRELSTEGETRANMAKPRLISRQLSLPSQLDRSSSISSASSKSGPLGKARRSSTSSSLPKPNQSTSLPRQGFTPPVLQRSLSHRSTPTYNPITSTKGTSSATMQSTRERVTKDWQEDFHPVRRFRRSSVGMEEESRPVKSQPVKPPRPQPPRPKPQARNIHESPTPLMKKTMSDAKEWTKAINRDNPWSQRYAGGEGYKWSDRPKVAKPTRDLDTGW